MAIRSCYALVCCALLALLSVPTSSLSQDGAVRQEQSAWHPSSSVVPASAESPVPSPAVTPVQADPPSTGSPGSGSLPNEQGQLWREYDIRPYTARVNSTARPELAVVDWIIADTGYEVWHGEPLAILSATADTLRVYHTPEMQGHVAEVVDRFVASKARTEAFGLRVVTVGHPNWRTQAMPKLRPVPVQTAGVQAWLLRKEDSAQLMADLGRRSDYREHSTPHLLVENGQPAVVSATRARGYVRSVQSRDDTLPGYVPESGVIDEGFALEFTPLMSRDGKVIEASIKCDVDQVEKVVPVSVNVPTVSMPRNHTKVDVPQIAQFRFHERFRWPGDQVLLIGLGMVPLPVPTEGRGIVGGLRIPFADVPGRADLLIFVETRPRDTGPAGAPGASDAVSGLQEGRF